jgi:hypothetical protein
MWYEVCGMRRSAESKSSKFRNKQTGMQLSTYFNVFRKYFVTLMLLERYQNCDQLIIELF